MSTHLEKEGERDFAADRTVRFNVHWVKWKQSPSAAVRMVFKHRPSQGGRLGWVGKNRKKSRRRSIVRRSHPSKNPRGEREKKDWGVEMEKLGRERESFTATAALLLAGERWELAR